MSTGKPLLTNHTFWVDDKWTKS